MIYHDPSKGPPPITIRIDAVDRASLVLGRLGDSLRQLADAFDPRRHVLNDLVPLVRVAAALDGGYRSLPRRILLLDNQGVGLNPVWLTDCVAQPVILTGWQQRILEEVYAELSPQILRFMDSGELP